MAGFKSVVRGFGLVWVAGLALAVWQYTPPRSAVAAPSPKAANALVAEASVTTATGPRVVYQGAIMGAPTPQKHLSSAVEVVTTSAALKEPYVWQDVPAQAAVAPAVAAISQPAVVKPVAPAVPHAFARLDAPKAEPKAAAVAATPSRRVDLNTASVAELNNLGGGMIGRAIVAGRPYRSAEDLLAKRVLNKGTFAQIKTQIAAQ